MNRRHLYLILAGIGILLPYSRLIPFLRANGMDMVGLFRAFFTSGHAVAFFALDLLVTAVVASVFIILEGRRRRIALWWTALAGLLLVGVSFALPWFLYLRERTAAAGD